MPRGESIMQYATYAVIFSVMVGYIIDRPAESTYIQFYGSIVLWSGILVMEILWNDLPNLFPVLEHNKLFWLTILSIMSLLSFYLSGSYGSVYVIFMIISQANIELPLPRAIGLTALLLLGFVLIILNFGLSPDSLVNLTVSLLIGLTFIITISQLVKSYSEQANRMKLLHDELKQANMELITARHKEKELTIAEERVRLARDIHDGLGHHLTVLSVQLQAAEKLLKTKPEMAAEAIRICRSETQAALLEVRQSVAVMRESPINPAELPATLSLMVNNFSANASLRASFYYEGDFSTLAPAAAQTLFRAVQEGLTNAKKHASNASRVVITINVKTSNTLLLIQDDGDGNLNETDSEGFGLAGLKERVAQLGGTCRCGPAQGGGFELSVSLPAAPLTA